MTPNLDKLLAKATARPWKVACDSYGKVRHSKDAVVYAGDGSKAKPLVSISRRVKNWNDAKLQALAVNKLEACVALLSWAVGQFADCETARQVADVEEGFSIQARALLAAIEEEAGR